MQLDVLQGLYAYHATINLHAHLHPQQLAQHYLNTSKALLRISKVRLESFMLYMELLTLASEPTVFLLYLLEPLVVLIVRGCHTLHDMRKNRSPVCLQICLLAVDASLGASSGQVHESFFWFVGL